MNSERWREIYRGLLYTRYYLAGLILAESVGYEGYSYSYFIKITQQTCMKKTELSITG